MLASILIICFAPALLIYWFRHCCALILRNSQNQLAALPAIEEDTRFAVSDVIDRLGTDAELPALHQALNRDYQVFKYLVEHAAGLELSGIDDRLLLVDYKLTQLWYRIALIAAPRQARQALAQMASILNVLVRKMGHQAGVGVEA